MHTRAANEPYICYVIMPFGAGEHAYEHRDRYSAIIEAGVRAHNDDPKRVRLIRLARADDPQNMGRISAQIIADLWKADIVIADLKGLNANVMYELGVRHTMRSATLILVPDGQEIPFDVQDMYVLKYSDRERAAEDLAQRLKTLTGLLAGDKLIEDSPVVADGLDRKRLPPLKLGYLGEEIAKIVGQHLSTTSDWAADALQHVRVGWISRPLFDERSRHFREEKEFIGRKFVDFLWQRCTHIAKEGYPRPTGEAVVARSSRKKGGSSNPPSPGAWKIYLVLDSGTTLVPLFRELAKRALKEHSDGNSKIVSAIEVVTNNLPGLGELVEHGRPEPNRYSEPVLSCQLLPGIPMPVYSAVAGQLTEDALTNLQQKSRDRGKALFSSVCLRATGSELGKPHRPVPYPWHGDGHIKVSSRCWSRFVTRPTYWLRSAKSW
jgi:hypothetical protein